MLTRRVIPCLDVQDGRVVKGVAFRNLRDVGDPIPLGARYAREGADELCFLNVSATVRGEQLAAELVDRVAREVFIPFTVGGGVRTVDDARALLCAGADKVAVNSAALERPELLTELSETFGSQAIVLSIDARRVDDGWLVTSHSASRTVAQSALDWAEEGVSRGAGEVLLNAIDTDGVRSGFSIDITAEIASKLTVPVIASGGAGSADHFVDLFENTTASAALAASIFHDGSTTPALLKSELSAQGIEVRP